MDNSNAIFEKRRLEEIGLNLYFYNVRTLMIYEYEILYQLTEGIWSSYRYPNGHSEPWVKANLFLTSGKTNARNVVDTGCNIIKNDYNLKRILDTSTSYSRIKSIGKLSIALENDIDTLMVLLNEGFHENSLILDDEYDESGYNDFINFLISKGCYHSVQVLSEEILESYINSEYTDEMMRDDLGMIQNTMRNTMSLHY